MGLFTSKKEKQVRRDRSDIDSIKSFDRRRNDSWYIDPIKSQEFEYKNEMLSYIISACGEERQFEGKGSRRLASAQKIRSVALAMQEESERQTRFANLTSEEHKEIQEYDVSGKYHEEFLENYGFIRQLQVERYPRMRKAREKQITIEQVIGDFCKQYAERKMQPSTTSSTFDPSVDTRELVTRVISKCQQQGLKKMYTYYERT